MRKVTRYICELCGATYATEEEARKCETFHAGGEILNYEYIGGSRYPYRVTLRFNSGAKVPYHRRRGRLMSDTINREAAIDTVSDIEVSKMEHCVGFVRSKVYHRSGVAYFKPYRNYYDAGGTDMQVWERLVEKGFADCAEQKKDGSKYYWLNRSGLNILSAYEECYIYSENARGNEIDASEDVIDILLEDDVYCGYGCWIPSGAKNIAIRARLPYKLTLSTLKYLQDKCGYAAHIYEGGCNGDGEVRCTHGWTLTKKWIDEHRERHTAAQQAEYKRIDKIGKDDRTMVPW